MKTYRLLRNGTACHVFDGDGSRFVRLFRETWRILSLVARREILRYWSQLPRGPRIELIDGWPHDKRGVIAQVERRGRVMRFHARHIDRMSDIEVCYVIAHELAHVLQSAVGIGWDTERCERHAHRFGLESLGMQPWSQKARSLPARIWHDMLPAAKAHP